MAGQAHLARSHRVLEEPLRRRPCQGSTSSWLDEPWLDWEGLLHPPVMGHMAVQADLRWPVLSRWQAVSLMCREWQQQIHGLAVPGQSAVPGQTAEPHVHRLGLSQGCWCQAAACLLPGPEAVPLTQWPLLCCSCVTAQLPHWCLCACAPFGSQLMTPSKSAHHVAEGPQAPRLCCFPGTALVVPPSWQACRGSLCLPLDAPLPTRQKSQQTRIARAGRAVAAWPRDALALAGQPQQDVMDPAQ